MKKDLNAKNFFESEERVADLVNGIGCGGQQCVSPEDIQPLDTQVLFGKLHLRDLFSSNSIPGKTRDAVKKVIFGVQCMVIGVENQETIDYSMVLRNMVYDAGEYERQAAKIRRSIRKYPRFSEMEEDAFDMAAGYAGDNEMLKMKDRYRKG